MSSTIWFALGTAIGVATPVIGLQLHSRLSARNNRPPAQRTVSAEHNASPYAAVQIVPGLFACGANADYEGARILAKDAPRLPLAGCDQSECGCRYKHLTNRRADDDRRSPVRTFNQSWQPQGDQEKRRVPDRRRSRRSSRARAYFNDHE